MKKYKIFLCFAILFGIMFIPFFSGCKKNDDKIKLTAPVSISYDFNIDTGKQIIVTQSNPLASSYIFGISDVENAKDKDYVKFVSENNYLDVSNIFLNAKTYYFYAQYVGTGNYLTSKISPIASKTIEYQLDTPYLTINNTTLNWLEIENADNYLIYSIINGKRELVTNTQYTTFDFDDYVNIKINNEGLSNKVSFLVVATSTQNYIRSADSNTVNYSAFLQLKIPTDVKIIESSNKKLLSWKAVNYCTSYTIKANITDTITVSVDDCTKNGNKLQYDLTSYIQLNGLGDYIFQVKSNNSSNYTESIYSDICTYKHTKKLDTPKNIIAVDQNPYIVISWDAVLLTTNPIQYVSEYELYISDISNNYQLKKIIINENGVSSSIVKNSIILSYELLGISSFNDLNNSNFLICVMAKGSGYYTDSSLSTEKPTLFFDDNTLKAPILHDNQSLNRLTWQAVQGATSYKIEIVGPSINTIRYTTNTYFDYGDFIYEVGDYSITCYALDNDNNISAASNVITKTVEPQFIQLSAPVLNSVILEDDSLIINFTPSQNALTYSLYIGNNLISNQITTQNNSVLLSDVVEFKQNGKIQFQLLANAYDYYTQSEKSNIKEFNTKLQTPYITLNGNILTWNPIANATDYTLFLDDKDFALSNIDTSLDLTAFVNENVARQVRLQATNQYLDNSEISDKVYYNRANEIHNGYTNQYFYYGQTYDYYITSFLELFDVVEYTYINFLPEVDIYINFEPNLTIEEKYDYISSSIHGTINYLVYITNNNKKTGQTTLSFNYAETSSEPTYDFEYTQFENAMQYAVNSTRNNDYKFAADNYLVSQDVYTTDGLLSAIQHHAKPVFKTSNYVAQNQYTVEDVYFKAKEILIEICDDTMTDYNKVLAIHDYIVTNVEYDYQGLANVNNYNNTKSAQLEKLLGYFHYIESPMFYGFAVCDGYAKLFALLCNLEEIDCIVINGLADKNDINSGHAWNKVGFDIDGDGEKEWLAVDCTYDDQNKEYKKMFLVHEYFLIPDSYLTNRSEDINEFHPYPSTTENEEMFYSYYEINGTPLKIDDPQILTSQITKYMNPNLKFNLEFIIKNDNSIDISQVLSYLSMLNISYKIFSYIHNSQYQLVYLYR